MKKILILCIISLIGITSKAQIKLADVSLNGTYNAKYISGFNTIANDSKYVIKKKQSIKTFDMNSGKKLETIFSPELCDNKVTHFFKYQFSKDETKLLIYTNKIKLYRRSYKTDVFVWDLKTKELTKIGEKIEIPSFSPNSKMVAYVKDNNLFYHNLTTNKATQITNDGEFNKIINGKPDWVYEEEFSYNKAYQWAGDNKHIAYVKFDESKVKQFNMTIFQGHEPSVKENELYPANYQFKYPKAGEVNSTVSLHLYNIENQKGAEIVLENEFEEFYIPRITRTKLDNQLAVIKTNRLQNKFDIFTIDLNNQKVTKTHRESNEKYVSENFLDNIFFTQNNENLIFISERTGYSQIHSLSIKNQVVSNITSGKYDVIGIEGIKDNKIYFTSAEISPLDRNLYSVDIDGSNKKLITEKKGWNSVQFTNSYKYFVNNFSDLKTPNIFTLHKSSGELIRELEDNSELANKIADFPKKQFFEVPNFENIKMNGWILKPTNFDPEKRYPLLLTQYSGPGSQQVKNSFSFNWYNFLAQEGYIVVCVDGRGTGARGEEFKKCTYKELGKFECEDQLAVVEHMVDTEFIDVNKIAIWGWSFGGFNVLNCMQKGNGVFKAGISIAPVTNWKYYDSIYTERYMQLPKDNKSGYYDNSPIATAKNLKGNLLICAGTADDNVHFQNTMEYVEELVQNNKMFDMMIYNNRNHSIYGGKTRLHLYTKFTNFLNQHLK